MGQARGIGVLAVVRTQTPGFLLCSHRYGCPRHASKAVLPTPSDICVQSRGMQRSVDRASLALGQGEESDCGSAVAVVW